MWRHSLQKWNWGSNTIATPKIGCICIYCYTVEDYCKWNKLGLRYFKPTFQELGSFLGAWCPLAAFISCIVEFTRCLNVLLMKLFGGGKSSPRPTPQQSWLLSCGVWREHAGLLSRPCRKRRPSSRDVGGVSWFFWSCGASVGFLTRYDRELREPLVWCQGSQVSIRVARGRTSLLSSHGRGIRAQHNEKGRSRSFSGCGRKPCTA